MELIIIACVIYTSQNPSNVHLASIFFVKRRKYKEVKNLAFAMGIRNDCQTVLFSDLKNDLCVLLYFPVHSEPLK